MSVDTGGPRYQHDCAVWPEDDNCCRFLGRLREFDIYVHPREYDHVEVVARDGDDGPEYISGPHAKELAFEFIAGRPSLSTDERTQITLAVNKQLDPDFPDGAGLLS